jgi:hypothetical protein
MQLGDSAGSDSVAPCCSCRCALIVFSVPVHAARSLQMRQMAQQRTVRPLLERATPVAVVAVRTQSRSDRAAVEEKMQQTEKNTKIRSKSQRELN